MPGEPLIEELTLDIQPALTALEPIQSAFDELISSFSTGLGEGISTALGNLSGLDTAPITDAVSTAITDAAATPVPVEGDVSGLTTAIDDATQVAPTVPVDGDVSGLDAAITDATDTTQTVPLDGDAGPLVAAIDDATSQPQTVPVEADITAAQDAIGSIEGDTVSIAVDADTSAAQDAIDGLGTSATGASGSIDALSGAVTGFATATGIAQGETGGLTAGLASIGPGAAAGVAGLAAFTGFIGESISLAADAEAQNKRFAATFGDLADQVRQIDVGGLNISLEELGKQSGTTNANLEASASKIGALGNGSHASSAQIVETTQSVLALGATMSVTNPRLGDAATVTDQLTRALQTGGARATQLGISLQSADIKARAQEIAGAGNEVSRFDLLMAGAQLATESFGNTLGTKFADGAQNAQVQLRALKVDVEETLVAVGGPLLEPLVTSLTAVLPVAKETGVALGALAQAVLPLVAALAPALGPVAAIIGDVAQGITALDDSVGSFPVPALIVLGVGLAGIAFNAGIATEALVLFDVAMGTALGPITIVVGALALLGAAFGLFHQSSDTIKVDAQGLTNALNDSGQAASDLAANIAPLNKALDDQITKTLGAGKAGQTALDGLGILGVSYGDLTKGLLGTTEQYDAFSLKISAATVDLTTHGHASDDTGAAVVSLGESISQVRQKLEDEDAALLAAAVSSGVLTKAQVDAATGADGAVAAYLKLKPVIDSAAIASQQAALATSKHSGALRDAISAFDPAKTAVADYSTKLQKLGLVQADADQLAKDQAAALQATTDKTILASGAVTQLNLDFVDGKIGAGQLEGGVYSLGTSMSAASGDVSGLQKDIDSFATSAVGALPNVGDAVTSFSSGVTTAFGNLVSAAGKSPAEVAKAQAALTAALDPQTFVTSLDKEAAAISAFQKNLTTLVSEGLGQLAGAIAAKGPVVGGQLAATFANDHTKAIAADGAVALVTTATGSFNTFAHGPEAAAQMGAGGAALMTAANDRAAATFNLTHPTQAQIDSAKALIAAAEPGFSGTAAAYAQSGVIAFEAKFGRLPTVAEIQTGKTDAALKAATGPMATTAGASAATVTDTFRKKLALEGTTTGAVSAAAEVLRTSQEIQTEAGRAGFDSSAAFATKFGITIPTATEVSAASALLQASGLPTDATTLGQVATGNFKGALGLGDATTSAISDSSNAWSGQVTITTGDSARIAGGVVGAQFDLGLAAGINNPFYIAKITAAGAAAAGAAKAGANSIIRPGSPSRLGIEIGQNFIEGLAAGITDTGNLTDTAAAAALSMSSSFGALTVPVHLTPAIGAFPPIPAGVVDIVPHLGPIVVPAAVAVTADLAPFTIPPTTVAVTPDLGTVVVPATTVAVAAQVAPIVLPTAHLETIATVAPVVLAPGTMQVTAHLEPIAVPPAVIDLAAHVQAVKIPAVEPITVATRPVELVAHLAPVVIPHGTVEVTPHVAAVTLPELTATVAPIVVPPVDLSVVPHVGAVTIPDVGVHVVPHVDAVAFAASTIAVTPHVGAVSIPAAVVDVVPHVGVVRLAAQTIDVSEHLAPLTLPTIPPTTVAVTPIVAQIAQPAEQTLKVTPVVGDLPIPKTVTVEILTHVANLATLAPVPVDVIPKIPAGVQPFKPGDITTFGSPDQIAAATKRLQELQSAEAQQQQATTQTDAANTALQQLISTAVGQLPTATTAMQAFSSAVTSATSTAATDWAALSKAQHSYNVDVTAVHDANKVVAQDLATFTSTTGPEHVAALQALAKAYTDQAAAEKVAAAELGQLTGAQKTNAAGQKALVDASFPANFLDGLRAQNSQLAGFSKDLKVLAGEGLTGLAEELAAEGPNVAKGLADALVKSTKDAKAAESLIDAGKKLASQFSSSLTTELAGQDFTAVGANAANKIVTGALASVNSAGDILFTALTDPFRAKKFTIPVSLAPTAIALTPAGSVVNPANPASAATSAQLLTLDLTITLPSGQVVTATTSPIPVPPPTGAKKARVAASVTAKARA